MTPQSTPHPTPRAPTVAATLASRNPLGSIPFPTRSPIVKNRIAREQIELLLWQFAAQGIQVLWACKPYLWIGIITFFLTFVLGYALAAFGLL